MSERQAKGLSVRFVLGAWLLAGIGLVGLFGVLRLTAAYTPVRTGARVPVAVQVEAPAEVPTAAPKPTRRAPAPSGELWTYKKNKKEYVVVDSYDKIPEEFRSTATQMQ